MDTSVSILILIAALVVMVVVAYSRRRALYTDFEPESEPEPEFTDEAESHCEIELGSDAAAVTDLPALDSAPDKPLGFGRKNAWIAVRTDDPVKVAEYLQLHDLRPANWRTGLAAAYNHYMTHLFVTPPVNGWVFVVGIALPNCGDLRRPDRCTPVLEALGQVYDPVFYFSAYSTLDFYAWARVDKAKISRAYACYGAVSIWNKGVKTREEKDLKLDFFANEPPEGHGEEYWDRKDLGYPSENDVFKLAGAWSLNPMILGSMDLPDTAGFVGRVPLSWSDYKYKNALLRQLSKLSRFWRVDFQELSPTERVFRVIWELEGEVNNGGFQLYFSISVGDNAFAAVDALGKIGAHETARIAAEANGLFPGGVPPADPGRRQAVLDALNPEQEALLKKLDEEFRHCPDNLTELLFEYVRQNAKDIEGLAEIAANRPLQRMEYIPY